MKENQNECGRSNLYPSDPWNKYAYVHCLYFAIKKKRIYFHSHKRYEQKTYYLKPYSLHTTRLMFSIYTI